MSLKNSDDIIGNRIRDLVLLTQETQNIHRRKVPQLVTLIHCTYSYAN